MSDLIGARFTVKTRDHRGKVRKAGQRLRGFLEEVSGLRQVAGVDVRMPSPERLSERFDRASRVRKAVRPAMEEVVEEIFQRTQDLVPVDTGALKTSGRTQFQAEGSAMTGTILYGGASDPKYVDYAFFVHEMVGANFRRPGSQAKFLEEPTRDGLNQFGDRIAEATREVWR